MSSIFLNPGTLNLPISAESFVTSNLPLSVNVFSSYKPMFLNSSPVKSGPKWQSKHLALVKNKVLPLIWAGDIAVVSSSFIHKSCGAEPSLSKLRWNSAKAVRILAESGWLLKTLLK